MQVIEQVIEGRGIRKDWLAQQLGISPSYLTRLLNGERRWTNELKAEASRVLMLPEDVLFFVPECPADATETS